MRFIKFLPKSFTLRAFTLGLALGVLINLLAAKPEGQTNVNVGQVILTGTDVTGSCLAGRIYIHRTTGAIYNCPSATLTWTLLGSGGGGGGESDTFCSNASSPDTCLSRGASAGFLGLSSTTNSTTNTFGIKNGAGAEVGAIGWSGNNFVVGTQGGVNGGTARDTILGSAAGATNGLYLATEATSRWQLSPNGDLLPVANNTYNIGSDGTRLVSTIYSTDFRNASGSIIGAGGACTNQVVTSIAARTGVPTCTTLTSAYTTGLATTAGDLSQFASTTSAQLATLLSNETGSGLAVFATSPSLTTPSLGVATATSLNGNTLTTGTYTLTGASGKTLTFNNNLTLAGTDATTITFPATSATIARTDAAQTFTGDQTFSAQILARVGSYNNVGYGFTGVANTGLYYSSGILFDIAGNVSLIVGSTSVLLPGLPLGFCAGGASTADLIVARSAAAVLQLGADFNGAAISQTLQAANGITGTNTTGGNFILASGKGTGSGAVSSLIFQTPTATGSGTTAQALATRASISQTGLSATHFIGIGTAPTVADTTAASCGTTAATIAGTDTAGKVTVGATSGTSCTVTFGTAWANAPSCTVSNETTANLSRATSTTTTVILAGTFVGADVLAYQCLGR